MTDVFDALNAEFEPELLGELKKGGTKLTYVPVAEVIARLNNVLGPNKWSVTDHKVWRDELNTNWVLAYVELTAEIEGEVTKKVGYGGIQIKMTGNKKDAPLDLGDEFKGAMSDALKKAATQLGVGLHLSRKEEALALEEEARYEARPKADHHSVRSIIAFKDSLADDDPTRAAFAKWWVDHIGRVKPEDADLTIDEADDCIEEFGIVVDIDSKAKKEEPAE